MTERLAIIKKNQAAKFKSFSKGASMADRVEIHGVHTEIDDNLKKYINRKILHLEKYVSVHARESLHVEVYIEECKTHSGKSCEVEVVVHLPKETIRLRDGTVNMFAAVDIVEEKLKLALIRYKETHDISKKERHLLHRAQTRSL